MHTVIKIEQSAESLFNAQPIIFYARDFLLRNALRGHPERFLPLNSPLVSFLLIFAAKQQETRSHRDFTVYAFSTFIILKRLK